MKTELMDFNWPAKNQSKEVQYTSPVKIYEMKDRDHLCLFSAYVKGDLLEWTLKDKDGFFHEMCKGKVSYQVYQVSVLSILVAKNTYVI